MPVNIFWVHQWNYVNVFLLFVILLFVQIKKNTGVKTNMHETIIDSIKYA